MVTSSIVKSDLESFEKYLGSYGNEVADLKGAWKGDSSNSLIKKFEDFSSRYTGVVEKQMNAFADACDLYIEYENCKRELANARSSRASAPDEKKSSWDNIIYQCESKKKKLANRINDKLSQITERLTASNRFGVVNDAITWAVGIANDNDYGYDVGLQGGASYKFDCASLVAHAYASAGVPLLNEQGACWGVSELGSAIENSGQFERAYYWGDAPSEEEAGWVTVDMLQPGDILYRGPGGGWGHAAMYIGDGKCVAAHYYNDSNPADEINVYDYTPEYWNCVYRYKGDN